MITFADYFTRLGKAAYLVNLVNEFRGTSGAIVPTGLVERWGLFVAEYDGEEANLRAAVARGTSQLSATVASQSSFLSWVSEALRTTTIEMANDSLPLSSKTTVRAVAQLIDDMLADNQTLAANTVAASVTPGGSNVGNGALVVGVRDGRGRALQYAYAESIAGTFAAADRITLAAPASAGSLLGADWPLGSGSSVQLAAVDADTGTANLVSNGGFEDYAVANTPDDWTLAVGAAGSAFLEEAAVVFAGDAALALVGNGSTQHALTQAITGLRSRTNYALNLFTRVSATPGAGVLVAELVDGTDTLIDDDEGNHNSLSIDCTALSTSYAAKGTTFRLPEPVPSTVKLRLRFSTALSNSRTVYLDHLALAPATQLYNGGPCAALFKGATSFSLADLFTLAVTNDLAGGLQTAAWRLLDLPTLGLMLPATTGSETIEDGDYIT